MTGIFSLEKLWALMTAEQRLRARVLLGLMLVGMVFEAMGVALVMPALALLTQHDLAKRYPALASWLDRLGNPDPAHLIIAGLLFLVGFYVVKTLFLSVLAWRQMQLVYGVQESLAHRLYAGYLRQPYVFHLQRNSAQMINLVLGEVGMLTHTGLPAGLLLLTESLGLFGIVLLLLLIEPVGALFVMVLFGVFGWGYVRCTRDLVLKWGQARQVHEERRLQHLQQGLGCVKDVQLLGREQNFLGQFRYHTAESARIGRKQSTLQQLPRLGLELAAIIGLAVLVTVMIWRGVPLESLLPALGLFTAAAFRLMPSINRILGAVQSLRYSWPAIETLDREIKILGDFSEAPGGQPLPFSTGLTVEDVSYRYPSTNTPALRGISLSITRCTSVGFVGASGSGKSTLMDVILGLLAPDSGIVKVDGVDIRSNLRGWQDQIGYVPQTIVLTDDSLRRNVAFGFADEEINEAAVWRAIRYAQLEAFVSGLPQGLDTPVGERGVRLSGGQRQRIGIARALYHDPPVLVLDEATSALDVVTERDFMDVVCALQGAKTVLIVAHRLSTVERCDYLYCLEAGQVVDAGPPASLLAARKMVPSQ